MRETKKRPKRGRRGRLRTVEVTLRFESSYSKRTIERVFLDAFDRPAHPRILEGDSISMRVRREVSDGP